MYFCKCVGKEQYIMIQILLLSVFLGGPAVFVVIWSIAKGLTMSYATTDQVS